jgi:hypothetical protein
MLHRDLGEILRRTIELYPTKYMPIILSKVAERTLSGTVHNPHSRNLTSAEINDSRPSTIPRYTSSFVTFTRV